MKLFHLSDLHLGKRVNEFPMLDDQKYILDQILSLAATHQPDAFLIAGDVYDKPVPPVEAVKEFDEFLCRLRQMQIPVLIISGNHDSAERMAFGARLMQQSGVYVSPAYQGAVMPITLQDTYGPVDVFLLPFIKPSTLRPFFPDTEIGDYTTAVALAISQMPIHPARRNILVTHQFVTGSARCESEELSVGGSDQVDGHVFEPFDYVALGHLHGPQNAFGPRVRYCGSPLKYSFSEVGHQKSVTVIDLGEKGDVKVSTLPLQPKHDMRCLKGDYNTLASRAFYQNTNQEDYLQITLTDEEDIPDGMAKLRVIYPRLLQLTYDNLRTRTAQTVTAAQTHLQKTPLALLQEFYEKQNNQPMSAEQEKLAMQLIESIWEEEA